MTTLKKKPETIVNVRSPDPHIVSNTKPFHDRLREEIDDTVMRKNVARVQKNIGAGRARIVEEMGEWEAWRDRAEEIRRHVLENLDYYLYTLSENVKKAGGHVFFAKTREEATDYIESILDKKESKLIVKSKSLLTEEIGLNERLAEKGIESIETDLGEFIVQMAEEKPAHVVIPAVNFSRREVRELLERRHGYQGSEEPTEMTAFVRDLLRPKFLAADVGITGCNFAVADSGSICLVTNEGNGRLVTTLPPTHIAVMGMERLVPSFADAELLIAMLCRSAVGAPLTSYISWLTPPRTSRNTDGPDEFHLVIVDNGRSDILGTVFDPILQCIRCGACMNICPCYRQVGGYGYGSIYPGPLGAVLAPLLGGYDTFGDMPQICSLCTACDTVCPVKIPLSGLIREHRRASVEMGIRPKAEGAALGMFGWINSHPTLWDTMMKTTARVHNTVVRDGQPLVNGPVIDKWLDARDLPQSDGESFRTWWKTHEKEMKKKEGKK